MSRKAKRIVSPEALEALVGTMLRHPPLTPVDLHMRIEAFDPMSVRRAMARILIESDLSAKEEFQLVQWLVQLNPESAATRLLDALGDATLQAGKRALAVIILTDGHESELHARMATVPREQQLEVMQAAQQWLNDRDTERRLAQSVVRPRPRKRAVPHKSAAHVAGPTQACRLKITLRGIRPAIWRRIEVRDDITLARLHVILQIAMGWTDSHLHEFRDPEWPNETISERKVTLRSLIEGGAKRFVYEYDFGDDWQHDVVIERIVELDPKAHYPRCLAGKRACPPEDCGGHWGYEELLQALADPKHPDHRDMRSWAGDFDPEELDLEAVNRGLRAIRGR